VSSGGIIRPSSLLVIVGRFFGMEDPFNHKQCHTTMSIAQLDTLYAAAVAAIDEADWSTAVAKLMAIQVRLATTPNSVFRR
jgi:outer membrane protein assembly factor BamD (BamD/ComL family)